jgi:hypothetical protein
MFSEIERIGEMFGVRDEDIPAFITAIADAMSVVEDYHGKVTNGGTYSC